MLARWRWREPHVRTHSGAQRLGVLLAPGEIAQVARARVPRQVGLAPPLHLRVLGGRCVRRRCAAHRAALDAIRSRARARRAHPVRTHELRRARPVATRDDGRACGGDHCARASSGDGATALDRGVDDGVVGGRRRLRSRRVGGEGETTHRRLRRCAQRERQAVRCLRRGAAHSRPPAAAAAAVSAPARVRPVQTDACLAGSARSVGAAADVVRIGHRPTPLTQATER